MTETQRTHWRPKPWEELTFTDDFMFQPQVSHECATCSASFRKA